MNNNDLSGEKEDITILNCHGLYNGSLANMVVVRMMLII